MMVPSSSSTMRSKGEIRDQLSLVGPVWLTLACRKAVDIIPVVFVGRLGADYLAAAGLATVTANVLGTSFLIGISGGLSTILTQAFGAQDYELMNVSVQRCAVIMLLACIPITLLVSQSESILISLGQEDSIASNTSLYLIYLVPGLWCMAISLCIIQWLYAMKRTKEAAIVSVIVAILCPICNYGYVYELNLGFIGSALTVSTSRFIELLGLIFIVCVSSILKQYNFSFDKRAWSHWGPLLSLGLPNMIMMTEWWASEIITFLAGFVGNPDISIAAMSIYQNTNTIAFILPKGFQISGSIRVGNELGANQPIRAKFAGWTATGLAFSISSFCGALLYSQRDRWSYVFSDDVAVAKELSKLFICLSIYVVADGVQCALTGVIKGIGKQILGGPVVVFCYYVVAVPLSFYLGFKCQWGLTGLVIGTLTGTWLHAMFYVIIVLATDWRTAAKIASTRKVDNSNNGISAEEIIDSDSASFSFYSISKGTSTDTSNFSMGPLQALPTPQSPGQVGLWDGKIDTSTHGRIGDGDDDDDCEDMHIYRWQKIKIEEAGFFPSIYRLFGMKTVTESKYELVLTDSGNGESEGDRDSNPYDDENDGDTGLETVVVFRRGTGTGSLRKGNGGNGDKATGV